MRNPPPLGFYSTWLQTQGSSGQAMISGEASEPLTPYTLRVVLLDVCGHSGNPEEPSPWCKHSPLRHWPPYHTSKRFLFCLKLAGAFQLLLEKWLDS